MNLRSTAITTSRAGSRRTRAVLLLAVALLALVPLAGSAQAGVDDYPGTLYLSGPSSSLVTGSFQLVPTAGLAAPASAPVATPAGAGLVGTGAYTYLYTLVDGDGVEIVSPTGSTTSTTTKQISVSGLPTTGEHVRLYRRKGTAGAFYRVADLPANAVDTVIDNMSDATAATNPALPLAANRLAASGGATGYSAFQPGVYAPTGLLANSALFPTAQLPGTQNKGWLVEGAGSVTIPAGTWTFAVQTKSGGNGTAQLAVGVWTITTAAGAIASSTQILDPNAASAQTQPPTNLTPANVTTTLSVALPQVSLASNEHLYVEFWRRQTAPYTSGSGDSRTITFNVYDGVARITHPAASGFATEPTLTAPADGASNTSALSAVFNDPDPSDTGTVEFNVCTVAAGAGSACGSVVDTGSSASVAKGATATWTIGAALTHGATYHWQARGHDALGGTSAWTATQSFVANAAPGTPALVAPAAGAKGSSHSVRASYSDSDGDAGTVDFRVCSSAAAAGSECTALVSNGSVGGVASAANATWTPGGPLVDGVYHWQARAVDSFGAASGWSATQTFVIDTTPPGAPSALGAVVAGDGLTLRWLAPGGEEISSYIVYVNGQPSETVSGQTYEAKLGRFDAADARTFAVAAVDTAGNVGARTGSLVGVPDVVGMTRARASATLAARGLVLGDQADGAAQPDRPGAVVVSQTPGVPTLVTTGSSVGVVFGAPAPAVVVPLLRFTDVSLSCTRPRALTALFWLREPARVSATLLDRRGKRVAAWRLGVVPKGSRRATLRYPAFLRPGRYRLSVAAAATGTERLSRPLNLVRAMFGARGAAGASPC